jgi:putative peptidoglycan lipid II flippase
MGPGVLGAGVTQLNLVISTALASLLPGGSVSYLYYADRLNQLPLGVVGIAVATAILPPLSRQGAPAISQARPRRRTAASNWRCC